MNHNRLLQQIYQHILDKDMGSDARALAVELRMTERTINNALNNTGSEEYSLLFEQLLTLCAEKGISVDAILRDIMRNEV